MKIATLKQFVVNVFYLMALVGFIDMATQAWTSGTVKPIHIVLGFFFPK